MNAWYKIALGGSAAVFLLAVIFFGVKESPSEDLSAGQPSDTSQQSAPSAAGSNNAPTSNVAMNTDTSSRSASSSDTVKKAPSLLERVKTQISESQKEEEAAAPKPAPTPVRAPAPVRASAPRPAPTNNSAVAPEKPAEPIQIDFDIEMPDDPAPTIVLDGQNPIVVEPAEAVVEAPRRPVPVVVPAPKPTRDTSESSIIRNGSSNTSANNFRRTAGTYTIQPGDTLSTIAMHEYGDEHAWVQISQANPLIDPIRLKVGQEIRLPSYDEIKKNRAEDNPPKPGKETHHIVRSGESLSTIAAKHYDKASEWRRIYNANRSRIGSNPDRLKAGMKLTIPPLIETD